MVLGMTDANIEKVEGFFSWRLFGNDSMLNACTIPPHPAPPHPAVGWMYGPHPQIS